MVNKTFHLTSKRKKKTPPPGGKTTQTSSCSNSSFSTITEGRFLEDSSSTYKQCLFLKENFVTISATSFASHGFQTKDHSKDRESVLVAESFPEGIIMNIQTIAPLVLF